jgi:hypothetical protein
VDVQDTISEAQFPFRARLYELLEARSIALAPGLGLNELEDAFDPAWLTAKYFQDFFPVLFPV